MSETPDFIDPYEAILYDRYSLQEVTENPAIAHMQLVRSGRSVCSSEKKAGAEVRAGLKVFLVSFRVVIFWAIAV